MPEEFEKIYPWRVRMFIVGEGETLTVDGELRRNLRVALRMSLLPIGIGGWAHAGDGWVVLWVDLGPATWDTASSADPSGP